MSNCKEFFLDDIQEITIHPTAGCSFPVPFAVQNITSMTGVTLSTAVMSLSVSGTGLITEPNSIQAKCSASLAAHGFIYSHSISANIQDDNDAVLTSFINIIGRKDHIVVLHRYDGSRYLCYSLPNSFLLKFSDSIHGQESRSIEISLSSNSPFVPIS